MAASAAAATVIVVAVKGAPATGSFVGLCEYDVSAPPPVGSLANTLPAAFAWRSVWSCAASELMLWVTCAVQLATSVALAAVTCLESAPPEAPLSLVTLMWVPGHWRGSGQGSPCHEVRLPVATFPFAPAAWSTYGAVAL